jgi:alpha-amylase
VKKTLWKACCTALLVCAAGACTQQKPATLAATSGSFADNPIVYFVVTDRFLDGNPANNGSYGRVREKDPNKDIGSFHGGDFAGLTKKLSEGYFKELGVNAIWITAPYEQMHGWVVGGNKEFRHYAYHGYYALDFTKLDANMGTEEELRALVSAAHSQGIRIVFDVVMNHPGYGDIATLSKFVGPRTEKKDGVLWKGYEAASLNEYHSFIDYNDPAWLNWWGADWVRSGLRGYQEGGRDEITKQLAYLPDFKTESTQKVGLPPLLKNKPDTKAVALPDATVRDYLVKWLTQWVADYGIDGFRADTVMHVEPEAWAALKKAGEQALAQWRKANPNKSPDNAPFWMTGEFWGHNIERTKLFDAGFDNMINFDFQGKLEEVKNNADLDKLYSDYAKTLAAPANHNVLSYISSHDTKLFDRTKLWDASAALMLAPGGVQIFYGDESARLPGPFTPGDKQQATRSFMNWDAMDTAMAAHWKKLGQFRARHVALAKGAHTKLADVPYTFSRVHAQDKVVIALGAKDNANIKVGSVFADGAAVRDAYSGATATVASGVVQIKADPRGIILLEEINK